MLVGRCTKSTGPQVAPEIITSSSSTTDLEATMVDGQVEAGVRVIVIETTVAATLPTRQIEIEATTTTEADTERTMIIHDRIILTVTEIPNSLSNHSDHQTEETPIKTRAIQRIRVKGPRKSPKGHHRKSAPILS